MKKSLFLILFFLLLLAQSYTLQAPISELSKTLNLIYYSCYLFNVPVKYEVALFMTESQGLVNKDCCEKKWADCKVIAHGVSQICLAAARWAGYTGTESDLSKPENNIPVATCYIHKVLKLKHGDLCKTTSTYKTGKDIYKSYYKQILKVEAKIK